MSPLAQILLTAGVGIVLTVIVAVIGFLLRRTVFDTVSGLQESFKTLETSISEKIVHLEGRISAYREEMLTHYARKSELTDNFSAHSQIWDEMNTFKVSTSIAMAKLQEKVDGFEKDIERIVEIEREIHRRSDR